MGKHVSVIFYIVVWLLGWVTDLSLMRLKFKPSRRDPPALFALFALCPGCRGTLLHEMMSDTVAAEPID